MMVSPVNDPPEILLHPGGFGLLPSGGALGTDEDVPLPLAMIVVHDKEMAAGGAGRLTISLQCSRGGFAIPSEEAAEEGELATMGVSWVVGGHAHGTGTGPWPAVVFSGGLAETNAVLVKLEYSPAPDWHGVDDLNVSRQARATCFPDACDILRVASVFRGSNLPSEWDIRQC